MRFYRSLSKVPINVKAKISLVVCAIIPKIKRDISSSASLVMVTGVRIVEYGFLLRLNK